MFKWSVIKAKIMTEYFFSREKSPDRDCYAEHDFLGDTVTIYLPEIKEALPHLYMYGKARDDLLAALSVAIFVHEDMHVLVNRCIDTTGNQEHDTIYQWISYFINKEED